MIKLPRQYANFNSANAHALETFIEGPEKDCLFPVWFGHALPEQPIYTIAPQLLACFCDNKLPPLEPEFYSADPSLFRLVVANILEVFSATRLACSALFCSSIMTETTATPNSTSFAIVFLDIIINSTYILFIIPYIASDWR